MFQQKIIRHQLSIEKSFFIDYLKNHGFYKTLFRGDEIIILKVKQDIFAIPNRCPHQLKKLDGFKIEDGHIVCPIHSYRFNLISGNGPGGCLEKSKVIVQEDGVFIEIKKSGLF